jgi:hypothetical protein
MQAEVRPATLVRDGKSIAPDPDFTSSDHGKSHAARPDNDNTAVARSMRADAGDRGIIGIDDRPERMPLQFQLLEGPFAANARKPDGSIR